MIKQILLNSVMIIWRNAKRLRVIQVFDQELYKGRELCKLIKNCAIFKIINLLAG